MAKINGCLKCLFIFFNVVFAIFGCLLIIGAVKSSGYNHQLSAVGGPNLIWSWVFAIGVLGISSLGIYAGCSEKQIILKIFAGFMAVGMIIMLIFGIVLAVTRNKVKQSFESASPELIEAVIKEKETRDMLDVLQHSLQCCGVVSASDWGDNIPQSCECSSSSHGYGGYGNDLYGFGGSGCKSKPLGVTGPDQIYKQTCGDFIFYWADLFFKIAMGIVFGFAVTALLGLLCSLLMIHQVRRYDNEGGASIAMKGY